MGPLRWVLLLIGAIVIGLIFAQSRGWLPNRKSLKRLPGIRKEPVIAELEPTDDLTDQQTEALAEPDPEQSKEPLILPDSKVITVRILPAPDAQFPAEELVLALRDAGLRHGDFGIFHNLAAPAQPGSKERIRYSVASLVEPGSFDLSNLKESSYRGVSIFMLLPAPEDGVKLFDEMLETARVIARSVDGRLLDEQGGAMSIQRERYMREEVIEYLRQYAQTDLARSFSAEA
ncbi:MAG: cell division protein ZipA C-terminal FtsZ-binding domain-containing protein [bacterium]